MIREKLVRPLLALIVITLGGCISAPPPAYRQVDKTAPSFQEARALETDKLIATGKSSHEAEKDRRLDQAHPLIQALQDLERPCGCWAYTVTTTTTNHLAGKTRVTIECYNPFQPEERLWTLLSFDGIAPDKTAQATYRRARLKKWKQQLKKRSSAKPLHERAGRDAVYNEFSSAASELTGQTTYTIILRPIDITGIGHVPRTLKTYTVNTAKNTVVRHTSTQLEPFTGTVLLMSFKIDEFESTTDYAQIDPALPPFVIHTTARTRGQAAGKDFSTETEEIFSDYKLVKCYDDRFQVKVGPLSVIDSLPVSD